MGKLAAKAVGLTESAVAADTRLGLNGRKQMEEKVRREREFPLSLLKGLADGFAVVDETGRQILVNDMLCTMTGYSEEELLNQRPPFKYWADEGLNDINETFEKTLRGIEGEYELIFKRKDGERFIALVSPRQTVDSDGNKLFFATVRDITERKRAEEALKRSNEFSRTVLNSMPDAVCVINIHDFTIVGANRAFLKQLGLRYEQAIGRTCYEVTHGRTEPCTPPDDVCPLVEVATGAKHSLMEHVHFTASGEKVYVEVSATPLFDEKERVTLVVHVARDITKRKRAEQDIRDQAERLVRLYEATQALTSSLDLGKVLNSALEVASRADPSTTATYVIALLDEKASQVKVLAARGAGTDKVLGMMLPTIKLPKEMRIALGRGEPVVQVAGQHNQGVSYDFLRGVDYVSRLGSRVILPLMVRDRFIGALAISNTEPVIPSDEEIRALSIFAGHVATAIENVRLMEQNTSRMEQIRSSALHTVQALAEAVDAKDPFTGGHSERVSGFATAIARELGLPSEEIEDIRIAGVLHDIGKIGIPIEILDRPRALTAEEQALVRTHVQLSSKILEDVDLSPMVKQAIAQHHERYDGIGYPRGLKGDEISLGGRILAVADALEAMTSNRPHRGRLRLKAVIAEIQKGMGTQFDPQVAEAALKLLTDGGIRQFKMAMLPDFTESMVEHEHQTQASS